MQFADLRYLYPNLKCHCGHPISAHSFNVLEHACLMLRCGCTRFQEAEDTPPPPKQKAPPGNGHSSEAPRSC